MLRKLLICTAVAALAACTQEAAPDAEAPAADPAVTDVAASDADMVPPGMADGEGQVAEAINPAYCYVVAVLYGAHAEERGAVGEAAAVGEIGARYRTLFDARYPGDQGNQYFASTRAVFDDLSEEQLAGEQGRCAEAVDQDWSGDDW